MPKNKPNKSKRSNAAYFTLMITALAAGAFPAAFAAWVDPYEVFKSTNRPTSITDLAEKAHYPLWKLAKYKPGQHSTIVLGDSRARALRDKYWHELGLEDALNLAYGGGTIPEIIETFKIVKNDEAIKNIIIGIQLRSFDEQHKAGMNRVPEAKKLLENKLEYLKNWSVIKSAWNIFYKENEEEIIQFEKAIPSIVGEAKADVLSGTSTIPLQNLLDPEICFGCDFPQNLAAIAKPSRVKGRWNGRGLGYFKGFGYLDDRQWRHVASWYDVTSTLEILPAKFEKQIKGSGHADWNGFEFSQNYWNHLSEISAWAKNNGKNLIFVIPPTVEKLQSTIKAARLDQLAHQFRLELANLGTVIDFDFPNKVTKDSSKFSDAYHFDSKIARQITGEVALALSPAIAARKRFIQHRKDLNCFDGQRDQLAVRTKGRAVEVLKGTNCRIWKGVSS